MTGFRFLAALTLLATLTACPKPTDDNDDIGRVPPKATLEVRALDTLRFDPPVLRARAGQVLTFKVTNAGKQDHQFILGEQVKLRLAPGETKEATQTFASKTQLEFMCRLNKHDKQGMVGRLTVS